jgi:lysophospholipase L1-like esterase
MKPLFKQRSLDTTKKVLESISKTRETTVTATATAKYNVVFLGTSMLERFSWDPDSVHAFNLTSFKDTRVLNLGVGGDRICNILYRVKELNILDQIKPFVNDNATFFIEGGANDIDRKKVDLNELVDGMQQIVKEIELKFPSSTIHIIGAFPRHSDIVSDLIVMERVYQLNLNLSKKKFSVNVFFHNLSSVFCKNDFLKITNVMNDAYYADQVHFNGDGALIFANYLSKLLK